MPFLLLPPLLCSAPLCAPANNSFDWGEIHTRYTFDKLWIHYCPVKTYHYFEKVGTFRKETKLSIMQLCSTDMLSSSFSSRKMRIIFWITWEIDIVHAVERWIYGSNKCQIRLFLSCSTSWHTKFDAPYYTEAWRYDYQRYIDSSYKLLLGSFGIKRLFCKIAIFYQSLEFGNL